MGLLNEAKNITIGDNVAQKVFCGNTQVWPNIPIEDRRILKFTIVSGDTLNMTTIKFFNKNKKEIFPILKDTTGWTFGEDVMYIMSSSTQVSGTTNLKTYEGITAYYTFALDFFQNCSNCTFINAKKINLSKLELPSISSMFLYCNSLEEVDVSEWDTSRCVGMAGVFAGCKKLKKIDVSKWNTSNAVHMESMFRTCENLKKIDVSKWDVSKVETFTYMFAFCSSLTELDLSGWNVSAAVSMDNMFLNCSALRSIGNTKWNIINVDTLDSLFQGCSSLTELDLSGWITSNVLEKMTYAFGDCTNLTTLNLANWNMTGMRYIHFAFKNCTNLQTLNLSKWTLREDVSTLGLFSNCNNLKQIIMLGTDEKTQKIIKDALKKENLNDVQIITD